MFPPSEIMLAAKSSGNVLVLAVSYRAQANCAKRETQLSHDAGPFSRLARRAVPAPLDGFSYSITRQGLTRKSEASTVYGMRVVSSPHSKSRYHKRSCRWVKFIRYPVKYASEKMAEKDHRKPCSACFPESVFR